MRWVALGLPAALLGGLVYVMARPEAEAVKPVDHKVSNERPKLENHKDQKTSNDKPKHEEIDPIKFLEMCLERYRKEVKSYGLIMYKQERIGGRLNEPEEIRVCFKEHPHSVYFQWLKGARKAERALYVEGKNDGKMLARPNGKIARLVAGDVAVRDVDGPDAKQSGRYTLAQFGLKKATERMLATWKRMRAKGLLKVEYLGLFEVPEAGNRSCYKYHAHYGEPTDDGVTDLTVYIDKETWLQVGSVLEGKDEMLIGAYFFRDIKLNATLPPNQFTRSALIP
jgi:hypothetical protein